MKIKYLLNDSDQDYVEYTLDPVNKRLKNEYVRNGLSVSQHSVDVASVLSLEPTKNPQVQLMKKGQIWDMHLFKIDASGRHVRKSISIVVPTHMQATKVIFTNNDAKTHTLVNYVTHPLEIYKSSLQVMKNDFTDITRVSGVSEAGGAAPAISGAGELLVGAGADLNVNIGGAGVVALDVTPLIIATKVNFVAPATSVADPAILLTIGTNKISIDRDEGIKYNGAPIFTGSEVGVSGNLLIEVRASGSYLHYNEHKASIPFVVATPVAQVNIKGNCDTGEKSRIENLYIQSLENYRMDAIPPAAVEDIDAVTGDTEIYLEWLPNTEADLAGYNVYVNGFIHNLAIIPTPDYQVTGLVNGVPVRIVVTAVDKSGNESPSKEVLEIRPFSNPAKEVSAISQFDNDQGVTFDWTSPTYTDFEKIVIYRADLTTGTQETLAVLNGTASQYQDAPRPPAGTYLYTIATRDKFGNETTGAKIKKHIRVLTP